MKNQRSKQGSEHEDSKIHQGRVLPEPAANPWLFFNATPMIQKAGR